MMNGKFACYWVHKKALFGALEVRNCVFAYLLPACLYLADVWKVLEASGKFLPGGQLEN